MHRAISVLAFLGLLASFTSIANAHSWNEQLSLIGPNGSFVSNGYPRGYVGRQDPGFNGNSMMWILPAAGQPRTKINDQDLLCHTNQRTPTQTSGYPRLAVAPGSFIAMKYLENGHVTQPLTQVGKQPKGGTVFVFGTTEPKPDDTLAGVLRWNADGSGGDKRGKLLQAQNFDDDRCYQLNPNPNENTRAAKFPNPVPGQPGTNHELWCESNVMIPNDAPIGKAYTLYWVWQWPTMPGTAGYPDGKDEYYTTCNDVDVQAQAPETGFFANTLKQQDPQEQAVSDYKSRTALQPMPWPKGVIQAKDSPPTPSTPSTPSSAPQPAPAGADAQALPTSSVAAAATTPAPAAAQPATGAISLDGNQAVAPAPQQPSNAMPASSSSVPPSSSSSSSSSSMVVPQALNLYQSSVVSSAPSPASAAATTSVPVPVPARGAPAASQSEQVVTVPAGSPIFMFNSAGKVVTLAKRAATIAPSTTTAITAVPTSVAGGGEGAIRLAARHRMAHAHHAGAAHGRWS